MQRWLNWRSNSTFAPISSRHGKRSLSESPPMCSVLASATAQRSRAGDVKPLHAKIGDLTSWRWRAVF